MAIYDFFLSRNNGPTVASYVGHKGRLFYDADEKVLRVSDGVTVGGFPITPTTLVSTTEPPVAAEGQLWYNPERFELWAYHNGDFRPTVDLATDVKIGGIKLGPGVTTNGQGQLIIDTAGLNFAFGDFYAFTNTGPSDGACLSSINTNQDINIVSNGTGKINVVGEFHIHKTNADLEGALQAEALFSISSNGNIRVLAPNAGGTTGAVQIIGNATGNSVIPNQTGIVLHVTGNQDMVSRTYYDGVNNYALLAGRRYNGTGLSPVNVKNGELFFRIAGQAATGTGFETFGPCQIDWVATENQGPSNQGGELRIRATPNGVSAFSGIVQVAAFNATTGVTVTSLTAGGAIRYDVAQNNSTVTQLTSKSTTVICNGLHGQITTSNSSLAKGAAVTFTVTNNAVTAVTDVPVVVVQSGATVDSYAISVTRVQVGSFNITITNNGTGPLTDTLVLNFAIIKVS